MLQPWIIGLSAVASIALAFAAVFATTTYNQELRSRQEVRDPDDKIKKKSIRTLGSCSYCNRDVNACNGYEMPCKHFLHYTCAMVLKKEFGRDFDSNLVCKACLYTRMNNSGALASSRNLRNRTPNRRRCVNCEREITTEDESHMMTCNLHYVHKTCWERMQPTSTTCPACMDNI